MLSDRLYYIGKKHNEILKYNIDFKIDVLLDYLCSVYIESILKEPYPLTNELESKLQSLLNNIGEL